MKRFYCFRAGDLMVGDVIRFEDEDDLPRDRYSYEATIVSAEGENIEVRIETIFGEPGLGVLIGNDPAHGPSRGQEISISVAEVRELAPRADLSRGQ